MLFPGVVVLLMIYTVVKYLVVCVLWLHHLVMCSSLFSLYLYIPCSFVVSLSTVYPFLSLLVHLLISSSPLPLSDSDCVWLIPARLTVVKTKYGHHSKQHKYKCGVVFVNNFADGSSVQSCSLAHFQCVWYIHCNTSQRSISRSFITVAMSSMAFRTICHDNNNHSSPCQRLQVPRFSLPSLTPSKHL